MARDFVIFGALRVLSAFIIQTAYVPDEYWQSVEVAHYLSFGYGYLTWEWTEQLRSYLYPCVFSVLFKLLALLHLDYVKIVVLAPRILQALLTAYADVCLLHWIRNPIFGRAPWAKITLVSSWYLFYVGSRTLYNTIEADLVAIALSLFPWPPSKDTDSCKYLCWGALACALRPTAALVLFPLCVFHVVRCSQRHVVLFKYFLIGTFTLALLLGTDFYITGNWVFSPLNFVKANVFQNIGSYYGQHPGLWYIVQGIPMMLGFQTIPFLYEVYHIVRGPIRQPYDTLLMFVFWITILIYSVQPHKETRFILPLLPISLFWTAGGLSRFERNTLKLKWKHFQGVMQQISRILPWLLLVTSAIPSLYFGLVHQRGTTEVMSWLSSRAAACPEQTNILFLMPCHSTPLYSHLHVNVPTRILTCVPDRRENPDKEFKDEADTFYSDHTSWLAKNYPEGKPQNLPSHIVLFDSLKPQLNRFFSFGEYREAVSIFHTHFPSDRVGARVVVMERDLFVGGCIGI